MSDERAEAKDDVLSVLHVVPYYPPDRIGGVGEVVAHLHEGLLARGHTSEVLTSGTSVEGSGIRRLAHTPGRFALRCAGSTGLAGDADLVHVHHGEALGLMLAMRWRRLPTPILLTLHVSPDRIRLAQRPFQIEGHTLGGGWRAFLNRNLTLRLRHGLDRAAIRASDRLSFISRSSARDVLPREAVESATVIYNAVPPAPETFGVTPEPTDLLYVGTYSTRKRVLALPFVIRDVRRRRPDSRIRVVGFDPNQHPDLLALVDELGVRKAFVFEGKRRSADLPRYYQASRLLVVPSAYEGLPMVMLEAFQNGLPCVATAVSGIPELVRDGVNGFVVGVDEPRQMAEKALQLLDDHALRERFSREGRRNVAERFNIDRQVDEYLQLYHDIRSSGRGRA